MGMANSAVEERRMTDHPQVGQLWVHSCPECERSEA
jgi:hypothetical protein